MVLWVVDAHPAYQAGLNVESLKREGYSALVVKATQSLTAYTAPATFDNWIQRARAVGLVPLAYHWLSNLDPVGQADHFTRRIEAHLGAGLGLAYDNEDTSSPCSLDTLARFAERMRYNTGHATALHYSGAWWARSRIGSFPLASLGLLGWDSKYVSGSGYASALFQGVPANWWVPGYGGFARSKMLQFSSRGTAGGITGNVDVNAFDGTPAELVALAEGKGTTMANETLQEQVDRYNTLNTLLCLAYMLDPLYVQEIDPATGQIKPEGVPKDNLLVRTMVEIRDAVKAAQPGQPMTPAQLDEFTERVIAELRVGLASVVEQALQPIRQGIGQFGADMVEAAKHLDQVDDEPVPPPAG